MLHPPIDLAIVGLAPQHARLLIVRKIGERGVDLRLSNIRLFEQAVERRRQRSFG